MKLTIGMAAYNNPTEVWFTVQALRLYQDLTDTEILVVDNYGNDKLQGFVEGWAHQRYVRYPDKQGTAAAKNKVLEEARGEWVLCLDSHVMLAPGTVKRFREWAAAHPDCSDLLHGPMLYDDLTNMADAMDPTWGSNMWGQWRNRSVSDELEPYEIYMHGMGLFACRRDAWPGFNPEFRGFGGEEGYIHEKVRQHGGKVLCLPWLKWLHYFRLGTPIPYTPLRDDQRHNYEVGFTELGLDKTEFYRHYGITAGA